MPDLAEPPLAAATLLAQRERFKAFLTARLGNAADADDVLQASLIRALARADELRDQTKAIAWFYQVLRRAAIDHVRSRRSADARELAWSTDASLAADPAGERAFCQCFEPLISTLKPHQAALLRAVDLEGSSVSSAANRLALSANQASVTLHRARTALREKLKLFCGACATGACLDCNCAHAIDAARPQ